jgi:hypothetical protein
VIDQVVLAEMAIKDWHPDVRAAAIENLADQTLLAKLAVKGGDDLVRIAAIKNLTDQVVLANIAANDCANSSVRAAAVKNLTDQTLLAKIAEGSDPFTCGEARRRLDSLARTTDPVLEP